MAPAAPPAPDRFARTALHASGGMGEVWTATDTALDRVVAVKRLKADAPEAVARFEREARITARLEHPGVVPVYEAGRDPDSGQPYYVMRFVRGRTLAEVAREFHQAADADGSRDPLELVRLLSAFVSVCHTVAYAHSHGVLHRDLKGENVVLGEYGEVVVLDWGVAKRVGEPELPAAGPSDTLAGVTLTRVGDTVGTPAYMAPEQAEGRPELLGTHTDVFGLGAVLYEILTGHPVYTGVTCQNVLVQALMGRVLPPRAHWPGVPPGLEAVCLRALSRNPAARPASAAELGREVQNWQDTERRRAEADRDRAFDRLREQQAALVALTRSELVAGTDPGAAVRRLVKVSADTLKVERVSVWRLSADRSVLRCEALYERSAGRHTGGAELRAADYPAYFAALAESEVIAADDAQTDPRTREFTAGYLKPLGIGAMMEVPIHPDGVLCHEHVGPPRAWTPDEQLFGIAVGNLAAHVLGPGRR